MRHMRDPNIGTATCLHAESAGVTALRRYGLASPGKHAGMREKNLFHQKGAQI